MRIIPVSKLNKKEILSALKEHLLNDGIIVYPTDTFYGLGCNFYSLPAQKKIDLIKGRSDSPYSIAISDTKMINELTSQSLSLFELFLNYHSPRKMTFLMKANKELDKKLLKGSMLIGIRIPDHLPVRKFIDFLGFPIISTSVNASGNPPLNSDDKIANFIKDSGFSSETIIISEGELDDSKGSTIIDLSDEIPAILREGDDLERVQRFIVDVQKKNL